MRRPRPASVVGWYWIISMSISGAPTRYAMAIPSPVQIRAFVVGVYICPFPPVARITALATNSSIAPSLMLRVSTPAMRPSSSWTRAVENHSS
jgi:hypothetical protein